jgi:hypothetical protein
MPSVSNPQPPVAYAPPPPGYTAPQSAGPPDTRSFDGAYKQTGDFFNASEGERPGAINPMSVTIAAVIILVLLILLLRFVF